MAESVVSLLLEKLASFIAEETLLRNVRDEIAYISGELQRILPLLKNADGREDDEIWVKQVRDVAYDIEDVLDDFLFDQRESNSQFYRNLVVRHQLAVVRKRSKQSGRSIIQQQHIIYVVRQLAYVYGRQQSYIQKMKKLTNTLRKLI